MSQIFLNMFKTSRRPAIPSDCENRDRQNRRGLTPHDVLPPSASWGPSQVVVSSKS